MMLVAAMALTLIADAPIFAWVDAKGAMHATDRLGDVPEPWHSAYEARLKEIEELRKQGKLPPEAPEAPDPPRARPSPSAPMVLPTAQSEEARRKAWKETMRVWRSELATATAQLKAVEERIAETGMNPILRQTPAVQAQLEDLEPEHVRAQVRVESARRMLMEVLPKRARDEHVPPVWLM